MRTRMGRNRKPPRLDSHQLVGVVLIVAVLVGFVGLVFGRLDIALVIGAIAFVVFLMLKPGRTGVYGDGGGSGIYDGDGGGGCGGD